jgi:uncharacterized protein (DUF302 family)
MLKVITGFIIAVVLMAVVALTSAQALMFNITPSPFGVEETAARIQANIQTPEMAAHGWKLSGLRDPSKAVAADGGNVLPVLLVEACSTKYSGPLLKIDTTRIFSILMPCTITVFKKDDGKTYIGTMNAGLMGKLFGVSEVMDKVAADQKKFLSFDPSEPAPPLINVRPGGGGGGGKDTSGC